VGRGGERGLTRVCLLHTLWSPCVCFPPHVDLVVCIPRMGVPPGFSPGCANALPQWVEPTRVCHTPRVGKFSDPLLEVEIFPPDLWCPPLTWSQRPSLLPPYPCSNRPKPHWKILRGKNNIANPSSPTILGYHPCRKPSHIISPSTSLD